MDKTTENMIIELCQGNPGAATVLRELQYFRKWPYMLSWLSKNGYKGSKLWELYKDRFKGSWLALGEFLEEQIISDRSREMETLTEKEKNFKFSDYLDKVEKPKEPMRVRIGRLFYVGK